MRRARRGVLAAAIIMILLSPGGAVVRPAEAPALVPIPEYVTFIHAGRLEQVLAGDDQATVLVDPASIPSDAMFMVPPLQIVDHWWAPDGKHVLVEVGSEATGTRKYYLCDSNGQNPLPVLYSASSSGPPHSLPPDVTTSSWTLDGSRLAITMNEDVRGWGEIHVIEMDGRDYFAVAGIRPAWSPDGSRIAYARRLADSGIGPPTVMVYEIEGTIGVAWDDPALIEIGAGEAPVFSPDGTEVLYRTWRTPEGDIGSSQQLAVASAEGGESRLLTDYGPADDMGGPAMISSFGWSRDGEHIYYLLGRRSDSQYVYEVAADGSYAEPAVISGLASEYTLSLDGSRLVYAGGDVFEASYQTRQQVFVRDLTSCAEWQVSPPELVDYACSNLSISNQDRYVVFDATLVPAGGTLAEASSREVWVATLDGSHAWRCATDAWGARSQPAWGQSTDSVTADDGPADDDTDAGGTGFWDRLGDAIASFFEWLGGLFG